MLRLSGEASNADPPTDAGASTWGGPMTSAAQRAGVAHSVFAHFSHSEGLEARRTRHRRLVPVRKQSGAADPTRNLLFAHERDSAPLSLRSEGRPHKARRGGIGCRELRTARVAQVEESRPEGRSRHRPVRSGGWLRNRPYVGPRPFFREPLREVASRGPPPSRPRQPQLLLDLLAIREPVLRVLDGATRPLNAEDVTRRRSQRTRHTTKTTPISGHIGDIFHSCHMSRQSKTPPQRGFLSGPWRTRTSNLGIKSPLLYQLS